MRDPRVLIIAIVASVGMVASITGIVILSALNKPTGDLLAVIGVAVIPVITALIGSIHEKVNSIKEQTNGTLTKLIEMISRSPALPPEKESENGH